MTTELTDKEEQLINDNLKYYKELDSESRRPTNEEEKNFVAVCRGYRAPETEHEKAYFKFSKRHAEKVRKKNKNIIKGALSKAEKRKKRFVSTPLPAMVPGGVSDIEEGTARDDFFSTKGWKSMRKQDYADWHKRKSDFDG